MRRVRVVQAFSVVGAALLITPATLGSTAGATTASGTDPLHDNGPGFDPHGDVTAFSVDYDSTITVSTTTAAFDDPVTSPSWIVQLTDISFAIDTNNDGMPDYLADYENNSVGGVELDVWKSVGFSAHDLLCAGTASFDAAASSYSGAFPASCIGSPASIRMTAFTAPVTGPAAMTTTSTLPGSTTTTSVPETTTTNELPPATTTTIPEPSTTFVVDVVTLPVSTSSTTVVESATSPTTVAAASATLPFTGSSAIALTLVAFCLIGAGLGLSRSRRRPH